MAIPFLQTWYQGQCDGYWEHAHGVVIETLDAPGWLVTVDLAETPLEKVGMDPIRRERSEKDWLKCEVAQKKFSGQGDPLKLIEILRIFQDWASRSRLSPGK